MLGSFDNESAHIFKVFVQYINYSTLAVNTQKTLNFCATKLHCGDRQLINKFHYVSH